MNADVSDDCPAVERGRAGPPVFEGTPIPRSALFGVMANDMIAADFLDAVPRHNIGEQIVAVLIRLVEQCGERLEVE